MRAWRINISMQNHLEFTFGSERLLATRQGALYWPKADILVVSDLHLGKAERMARRGAGLLPPYDTPETLARLSEEITLYDPATVICLGDSFDDLEAARNLSPYLARRLGPMQAGRRWIWVLGNHDAGPVNLSGEHLDDVEVAPFVLRHIAQTDLPSTAFEISGHYHPKLRISARGRSLSRPAFLMDHHRLILPAFGAYTGGLWVDDPAFDAVIGSGAQAIALGQPPVLMPLKR
ncbi:ligase-associated DNA damage response endonuclease PdeM [Rhodobacteraceae bacterium XHP0102]|nr:ligase-associated DNA damage response endonuclease PdeM [Rhodobacteraceae bacterium XHP0102]